MAIYTYVHVQRYILICAHCFFGELLNTAFMPLYVCTHYCAVREHDPPPNFCTPLPVLTSPRVILFLRNLARNCWEQKYSVQCTCVMYYFSLTQTPPPHIRIFQGNTDVCCSRRDGVDCAVISLFSRGVAVAYQLVYIQI